jgi:hypothetical protein
VSVPLPVGKVAHDSLFGVVDHQGCEINLAALGRGITRRTGRGGSLHQSAGRDGENRHNAIAAKVQRRTRWNCRLRPVDKVRRMLSVEGLQRDPIPSGHPVA